MFVSRQRFIEPYSVRVDPSRRRLRPQIRFNVIRKFSRGAVQQEDAPSDPLRIGVT